MSDDMTARLREMVAKVMLDLHKGWTNFGTEGIIHAALLAAVRMGMEKSALIALESRAKPEVENNQWFRMRSGIAKAIRDAMPGE